MMLLGVVVLIAVLWVLRLAGQWWLYVVSLGLFAAAVILRISPIAVVGPGFGPTFAAMGWMLVYGKKDSRRRQALAKVAAENHPESAGENS